MKNNRWLSLTILCTGFLLIVVDMTIVNVALPSIQRDLGFSQSGLAWVINGYLIAFGGFLLLAGRLGDLFGRKRLYLIGLAIFPAHRCCAACPSASRCSSPRASSRASAAP
jgi:MFS family permease